MQSYEEARHRGFDNLPVRDADGHIRRMVRNDALRAAKSWDVLETEAVPIDTDLLVARDAPVFSLLDRFAHRDILFCLGRQGIDGVVTVYDLNQPAAHLFAFGLILICESELADLLRRHLGENPGVAKERAEAVLGRGRMGVRRWDRARAENNDLHLSSSLTFGEKLELLPHFGLEELAARLAVAPDRLLAQLDEIKALRDALAHYDDGDRLADPHRVYEQMRRTYAVAQRIASEAAAPE
jgi:hypothetical protein